MVSLTIKHTEEMEDNHSTFLDVLLTRNTDLSITRCWQKECSARQIINSHSYHPLQLTRNVVSEYARHAISVTSPEFMNVTVKNLRSVFRRSSYPSNFTEPIIKCLTNSFGDVHVTSMVGSVDEAFDFVAELESRSTVLPNKDKRKNDKDEGMNETKRLKMQGKMKYVPLPLHGMNIFNDLKNITRKNLGNCNFASRTTRNNKKEMFSMLKDKSTFSGNIIELLISMLGGQPNIIIIITLKVHP